VCGNPVAVMFLASQPLLLETRAIESTERVPSNLHRKNASKISHAARVCGRRKLLGSFALGSKNQAARAWRDKGPLSRHVRTTAEMAFASDTFASLARDVAEYLRRHLSRDIASYHPTAEPPVDSTSAVARLDILPYGSPKSPADRQKAGGARRHPRLLRGADDASPGSPSYAGPMMRLLRGAGDASSGSPSYAGPMMRLLRGADDASSSGPMMRLLCGMVIVSEDS